MTRLTRMDNTKKHHRLRGGQPKKRTGRLVIRFKLPGWTAVLLRRLQTTKFYAVLKKYLPSRRKHPGLARVGDCSFVCAVARRNCGPGTLEHLIRDITVSTTGTGSQPGQSDCVRAVKLLKGGRQLVGNVDTVGLHTGLR